MKQTNLENLKNLLKLFLMMDVEETAFSPLIVQHPIFEYGDYFDEKGNHLSVLEPEGLEQMRQNTIKRIERCEDSIECMLIMRKAYYLTFLKFAINDLSKDDFSTLLEYAWTISEAPNNDVNVSQSDVLRWFKNANKEKLMNKEDYAKYLNFPDSITVYRGVGSKSREDGISWTIDKKTAIWFANRFSSKGYVLQGVVEKDDILAFFNDRNESEIIVSPKKVKEKIKLP